MNESDFYKVLRPRSRCALLATGRQKFDCAPRVILSEGEAVVEVLRSKTAVRRDLVGLRSG